jgi:oligoribonuclease NrnB/cAMP/cGMP phosphodiesterase (DHH superfamily)
VSKPICIYHGNCADGFGAAWVFKRWADREFDFHAGVYQNDPPDVTGRDVYLVDFSYKRAVVEQMRERCNRLVLIDHHKTAIDDLAPLIESKAIESLVSLDHSGAVLAWKWFHGHLDGEMPALLRHIEDRDLWRFALHRTREIQANVFSYPYDFDVWDKLMEADPQKLADEGAAIERKHFKDIAELVKVVTREFTIGGHTVRKPALHAHERCRSYARQGQAVCRVLLGYSRRQSVQPAIHRRRLGRVRHCQAIRRRRASQRKRVPRPI